MQNLIDQLKQLQEIEVAFTGLYEFEMARGELHVAIDYWNQVYNKCLEHLEAHNVKAVAVLGKLSEAYTTAMRHGDLELAAKSKAVMTTIHMRMAEDWTFARAHLASFEQEFFGMSHETLMVELSKTPWLLVEGHLLERVTLH
jgi:hypothetical protein